MLQRYFWLAHVLLVTLAAFLVADLATSYIGAKLATPVTAEPTQTSQAPALRPRAAANDYQVIATRNIFHANPPQPDQPSKQPPPPPESAMQATELRLQLVGTVAGANDQRYAIIGDLSHRGAQALYQVGNVVQNALIAEIHPDCVVLDKGGQYESLCFQPESETTPPVRTARRQPAPSAAPETNRDPDGVVRVDAATWRISRELILDQFGTFGGLSSQARMMPYIVQGQTQGFRITRLKRDSMLQKIGLQNGDVIRKVNGLNITSPAEALQAFQQLQTASTVRLQPLRQNRDTTLTYELR